MSIRKQLPEALNDFREAKKAIEKTFSASGAPEIVSAALNHRLPRNGTCSNGFAYSVHGIGYTVTFPDGGEVHLDGSRQGDCFTLYDLEFYFETSPKFEEMTIENIERECSLMVIQGVLQEVRTGVYLLL
ncbi:DUF6896 domain-containing protein [Streptomyces sp. NPDC048516]|uniref:DUF6896 domain-containing protein n=1 Tax=Streptomyces sp. NPDC048516 TaxID=3365565 RepID=UPI0037159DF7